MGLAAGELVPLAGEQAPPFFVPSSGGKTLAMLCWGEVWPEAARGGNQLDRVEILKS